MTKVSSLNRLLRLGICAFVAMCYVISPGTAEAQYGRGGAWYRGGGNRGVNFNYGYSSTAAEGAARGAAAMISASGQANLNNSEALINVQEANSKYIDNKYKWTKTYLERKKMYREFHAEEVEKDRAALQRYMAQNRAKSHMPQLSPDQYDEVSAYINWPEPLQGDEYAEYRKQIEEVALVRAHASSGGNTTKKMYDLATSMQNELKKHIREMNSLDYIAARKFLDGLAYSGYASR